MPNNNKYINESGFRRIWNKIKLKMSTKVDKETGKGLSTNDYTTAEKNKLTGIEAGAKANVQSDWNQTDTSADDFIKNKPSLPYVSYEVQELTPEQKVQACANIGAGSSTFSGSYNDLSDKPPLGTASSKDTGTSAGNVPVLDSSGKIDPDVLPSYPVTSVNSKTGNVNLTYADVGAAAANHSHAYIPINGNSTINGGATGSPLTIRGYDSTTASTSIAFKDNVGNSRGQLGVNSSHQPVYIYGTEHRLAYYSDIPTSLPASDVYSWAKASSKPTYSWSEITEKPSSFTPASHKHYYLVTEADNRDVATTPNQYNNTFIFSGLKTNSYIGSPSSDTYSYVLGLRGWSDNSGGNSWELAFNNTGIFARKGETTSWDSWSQLITSSNIGSQSVSYASSAGSVAWGNVSGKPTKVSDFPNDAGYLTSHQDISGKLDNAGANPNCGDGTVITQPAGNSRISIRTTSGGRDTGILMLSEDCAYICNSSDNTYSFAVWDTDTTQDFSASNIGNASFVVLENGAGLQTRGNTVIHSGNISNYAITSHQSLDGCAKIGEHNNLMAGGNEFTFASSGFSGVIYLNYRTAGGTNGNITEYILGNGAGDILGTVIHSGNIGSYAITSHQSLAGYATESWVEGKGYLTSHQSLSGYATQTWVENKGYITGITSSMVTDALGYTPPTQDTTYSSLPASNRGTAVSLVTTGEKYTWNNKHSYRHTIKISGSKGTGIMVFISSSNTSCSGSGNLYPLANMLLNSGFNSMNNMYPVHLTSTASTGTISSSVIGIWGLSGYRLTLLIRSSGESMSTSSGDDGSAGWTFTDKVETVC